MLERALAHILAAVLGPSITSLQRAIGERWRGFRSESWPMAFGNVQSIEISQSQDFLWRATLAYSYTVAGEYYSGFLKQQFARERDVDDFAHQFPSGLKIFVHYNPTRPERSLVRLRENATVLV